MHEASNNVTFVISNLKSLLGTDFDHILQKLKDGVSHLQEEQENYSRGLSERANTVLGDLYQRSRQNIHRLQCPVPSIFRYHGNILIYELLRSQLSRTQNQIQRDWMSLGDELNNLAQVRKIHTSLFQLVRNAIDQQTVVKLSATGSELAHTLQNSIHQAKILNQAQVDATLSTSKLVLALSNLTSATQTELEKVANVSTALARNSRLVSDYGSVSWGFMTFLDMLKWAARRLSQQHILSFIDPTPITVDLDLFPGSVASSCRTHRFGDPCQAKNPCTTVPAREHPALQVGIDREFLEYRNACIVREWEHEVATEPM
ncbi:hypothetical protein H0H93_009021 [Arthromyces matolae]|nr:hypothetical protein H0H93_009021 [Arthromyces matolae]